MRVAIIEDEQPAIEKLEMYLQKYSASIQVMARLKSIRESVDWLRQYASEIDLVFLDIQLEDGLSFDIFQHVPLAKPIIFTTAYDEYAVDAFRVNSIDYLLKPITYTALVQALKKLDSLKAQLANQAVITQVLPQLSRPSYKDRFLVKRGAHIRAVDVKDIGLFYAEGRIVYLITRDNKKFIVDYRLEDLEKLLNPQVFFRINRSYIVPLHGITKVEVYSNRRLKIVPAIPQTQNIIVSREKVVAFKSWLEGN